MTIQITTAYLDQHQHQHKQQDQQVKNNNNNYKSNNNDKISNKQHSNDNDNNNNNNDIYKNKITNHIIVRTVPILRMITTITRKMTSDIMLITISKYSNNRKRNSTTLIKTCEYNNNKQ